MKDEDFVEFVEEVVDDRVEVVTVDGDVPSETDQEWYDFLIDNLYENELVDGNPTTDGLRRLTEKYFGEILDSESQVIETEHDGNGLRCTMKHTLTILKYRNKSCIKVSACVDVDYRGVPHPFNKHVVATADTRAEGKALRRALKLRVVTAEEAQTQVGEDDVLSSQDHINDQQVMAINAVCRKYDLNVEKVTKSVYNNVKSIKQLNNLEGQVLMDKITSYQREKSIPEELLGYDASWQSSF